MNTNRWMVWLVVVGYLAVNVTMQIDFFAGRDIFAKYQQAATAAEQLLIASEAYYAKTAFLLILLVLLAAGVPFGLAFALSFLAYAGCMLAFFGWGRATGVYTVASLALLGSYVWDRKRRAHGKTLLS